MKVKAGWGFGCIGFFFTMMVSYYVFIYIFCQFWTRLLETTCNKKGSWRKVFVIGYAAVVTWQGTEFDQHGRHCCVRFIDTGVTSLLCCSPCCCCISLPAEGNPVQDRKRSRISWFLCEVTCAGAHMFYSDVQGARTWADIVCFSAGVTSSPNEQLSESRRGKRKRRSNRAVKETICTKTAADHTRSYLKAS